MVLLFEVCYYSPLCLSGIEECRKGSSPSVRLSVHLHAFLHDGWIDFLHIKYHDQVSWATDACETEFGSVPNLSNYGYFFINLDFWLWYLCKECGVVHICYSFYVQCIAHACKIAFGSMPNSGGVINMATFSYILCICCGITAKNGLILFKFGNQVPCVANTCKISFGSMLCMLPNLSNYANIFLKF